jgi:hypothetical protein
MTPDQPISLALAIAGVVLALALPRRYALLPLALAMCLYPSIMLLPPTQLSLTPQRLIGIVLLLRCAASPSIRAAFRWQTVDTAALGYYLLLVISQVMSTTLGPALNNRIGFFLDAMAPFWCARFLITDRPALYALIKGLLWAALPLAILGFYEMQFTYNPWDYLRPYGMFKTPRQSDGWRLFMGTLHARARGPFLQYIMFGWFFALLIAMGTNLWFQKRRTLPWIIPWLFLPLGVISSIASGPLTLAVFSAALAALFPWRRHWKIGLCTASILLAAALAYSNRSPMELLASFGMDPLSSWYRVGLVRFTLNYGGMKGHWFVGYGQIPPAYENFHDLCIHWVWLLVVHGLLGVIGFYGLIGAVGHRLWRAKQNAAALEDQWLLWTMMATLLGSLGAMLVVALFSETYFIYHMFLGVLANAPLLVGAAWRHVDLPAQLHGRPVTLRFRLKPGQKLVLVRPVRAAKPIHHSTRSADDIKTPAPPA